MKHNLSNIRVHTFITDGKGSLSLLCAAILQNMILRNRFCGWKTSKQYEIEVVHGFLKGFVDSKMYPAFRANLDIT